MRVIPLLVLGSVLSSGCYETHGRSDAGPRDSSFDSRADTTVPPRDTGVDTIIPPPPGDCRPGEAVRCGPGDLGVRFCSGAGNWCRCNTEFDMGSPGGWSGCRASGVWVCEELVADAPCYWENHPRCVSNPHCDGMFFTCNSDCPEPGPADRCVCEIGDADGWDGCSGDGCGVCDSVLEEFPCYYRHNFACARVDCTIGGSPLQCNGRLCPPPTDEDRGAP